MANNQRLLGLLNASTSGYAAVMQMLLAQLAALWNGVTRDQYYDGDLVLAHAARSSSLVDSASEAVRRQTTSYFRHMFNQYDDLDFPTDAEIEAGWEDLLDRAVNPLDEWNRPAEQYRYARSQGSNEEEAQVVALNRVDQLGDMDLQVARRNRSSQIISKSKATGYRRVLHPELSDSKTSCGLCIAASTRIYKKDELLPIHEHCNCGIMPVVGEEDPGNVFNQQDLEALYAAAGDTGAQALSRVRYKVTENGELGPYLVEEGAKNRSVGKKIKPVSRRDSVAAQINSLEASLPRLVDRSNAGENLGQAITWQQDRLRILRQEFSEMNRKRKG